MRDLLFEIGVEEIPAGYLDPALAQLQAMFVARAEELKLGFGSVRVLGTPRRLALLVSGLAEKQDDIKEELLGPSKKAAFDAEGKATRAAEGFAKSKGVSVEDLQTVDTPKGEYLMLTREVPGRETISLLPEVLKEFIAKLSFPKSMRWGSNMQPFARPIQWLVALFGDDIVPFELEGISTGNVTGGHRFHAKERVPVTNMSSYLDLMEKLQVVAEPAKRREMVIDTITQAVADSSVMCGGKVAIDEALVDTVTNLVEKPYGICGSFDEKFLQLPPEVLITSMREHQKYFPVVDEKGQLMPGFVAVNNTNVNDADITRKGHQRVLRARLEDALFFFNSDREKTLESRIPQLEGIIFQAKLGTMLEKNDRLVKLTKLLAEKIEPSLADDGCRAAMLCKTDLLSDMVGEFPSLQGIMGGAYASHDGEKEGIALAIREHYMPKRAGEPVPESALGAILGLADRIDTIAGCFGIGQVPTGTADPFGLRRIALAIMHIIEEKNYTLSLAEVMQKALALYGDKVDGSSGTVDAIVGFIKGRFTNDCTARGMDAACVEAAVSVNFDDITDCLARLKAILEFRQNESFKVLAGSYKRIRNIIKDNDDVAVDSALFEMAAEKDLYALFCKVKDEMAQLVANRKYSEALSTMLQMKEPVDQFFDKVMVMAEDEAVRRNRLNLLTALGELILQIGDISKVQEN